MKMYEKLGIDPATEEGALKIAKLLCSDIPDGMYEPNEPCPTEDCIKCKIHCLFSDVNTKKIKRFERVKGKFDLVNLANIYIEEERDHGNDCVDYHSVIGFVNMLCEEIEVVE